MTVRELRDLCDRLVVASVGEDTQVTVFGPGPGLPIALTGDWSRPPGNDMPVQLHGQIQEPARA